MELKSVLEATGQFNRELKSALEAAGRGEPIHASSAAWLLAERAELRRLLRALLGTPASPSQRDEDEAAAERVLAAGDMK